MATRYSWKGYIRFSLVSIPVQATNAESAEGGAVHFHQLHATCHSRIRYQKVCPIHGEVSNDEIVLAHETSPGKYVVMEGAPRATSRRQGEREVNIDTFVEPHRIDPIYFEGRTYFLAPDGQMGAKPYAVLLEALTAERRWAIGQGVLFGRDQLILLRPSEGLLFMELLHYQSELRSPAEFLEKIQEIPNVGREELRLAAKLIQTSTRKKFDFARYVDEQTAELKRKIESSVDEAVTAPGEAEGEEAPVINLMDALRKSVARAHHGAKASSRPARKPRRAKRTSHRRSAG